MNGSLAFSRRSSGASSEARRLAFRSVGMSGLSVSTAERPSPQLQV
jgi:hypothetical protein